MERTIREYDGTAITVTYDIPRCIHAEECIHGLSGVFDRDRRPWIAPDEADADRVAEVVVQCPAGALKYRRHDGGAEEATPAENTVTIDPDGPLYVRGDVRLVTPKGEEVLTDTRIALCRCGASKNKPLCDGSHTEAGFRDPGAEGRGPAADAPTGPYGPLTVTLAPNGPLISSGSYAVVASDGARTHHQKGAWCRCGASKNKPYCDGAHKAIGFQTD